MGKTVGNLGNKAIKIIFLLFSLATFGSKQAMADNLNGDNGKSISFVRISENAKPANLVNVEKSAKVNKNEKAALAAKADKKIKKSVIVSSEASGTGIASTKYQKGEKQQIASPLDLLKKEKAAKKQATLSYKVPKPSAKSTQTVNVKPVPVKAAEKTAPKIFTAVNKSAVSPNNSKAMPVNSVVEQKPVVKMASVERKATSFRETVQPIAKENVTFVSEEQMFRELGIEKMADNATQAGAYESSVRPQDVANYQKVGSPYQVNGKWYIPSHEPEYDETGVASWYGDQFNGKQTANGETFDMNEITVAHPTLPLPSLVEVTNLDNGRTIIARANDRGPFASDRLIDVSKRAAILLGFKDKGTANVRVRYVGQAPQINDSIKNNKVMLAQNDVPKAKPKPAIMAQKPVEKAVNAPVILAQNIPAKTIQPKAAPAQPKTILVQSVSKNLNYVQIGAFASRANADKLANNSKAQGNVKITEVQTANGVLYRVLLAQGTDLQANNKALVKKQFYANAD